MAGGTPSKYAVVEAPFGVLVEHVVETYVSSSSVIGVLESVENDVLRALALSVGGRTVNATLATDPDVLDVVRIAFALCAAVGDDEQSHICRGFWSAIMDIILEGNAREMEADQKELDANFIGQEVDAIVNVLKSVDEDFVIAICRAAMEGGATSAGYTLPVVITLFELVFNSSYDLSFADKAVALGNPTFVLIVIACILTATIVLVNIDGPQTILVEQVMTMLRYYLEVVERLAKNLSNQRNSGNRESECPKREKREKQQEKENLERKKQEEQWTRECLKRMKREAHRGRDSQYHDMVRLQNIVDTMREKRSTLTFASWNILAFNPREYSDHICYMLRALDVDIAALQETRWLGSDSLDEEHYTFSWKGTEENQRHGVGFAVKKKYNDKIESVGEGSERLLVRRIQTTDGPVILISAYVPTEGSPSEDKDQFYEQLDDLMNTIRTHEHVILMGDFNAMVGADSVAWKDIIGPHGVKAKTNNNGTRLLEFCQNFKLCITNTFSEPTFTFMHRGTNPWALLITRMSFRHKVVSYRCCDCGSYDSDHNIVACKVKLYLKKQHESEGELKLKKQQESEGELKLKKQHESEGELKLKKQHESEGELMLKKQHESEGELKLKKQHESEGELKLKKQHESEGELKLKKQNESEGELMLKKQHE